MLSLCLIKLISTDTKKFNLMNHSINPQLNLFNNIKTFRTIHYLGSKLRLVEFIQEVIDEVDPSMGGVCDLFAGSGSVTQHLSNNRKIIAVDVQEYSEIICNALLNPISDDFILSFSNRVKESKVLEELSFNFKEIISLEEELLDESVNVDPERICDFLENSSIYSAEISLPVNSHRDLKNVLQVSTDKLKKMNSRCLAFRYFGGVYFSFKQSIEIDAILESITKADSKYKYILSAALLSTASDIVNTVGKQFAQPLRPRDKSGRPKKSLLKQFRKDRKLDVFDIFSNWVIRYSSRQITTKGHKFFKQDCFDVIDLLDSDIKTVYADPPYTRDHYSRFYHGLETLCLKDFPEISTTTIKGTTSLSRGLYRKDRHQSEFCIRSKAPTAFRRLFQKVSSTDKSLIVSYSPYSKEKGAHPRVVELEYLEKLASEYFNLVEIRSPGNFSHSKLNKTDLHLDSEKDSEILLVCKNA